MSHDEIPVDIRKQIADYQQKINSLSNLKGNQRDDSISKCEKQGKRIRRLMETYQYSIQSGSFETAIETHKSQYKQFDQQLIRLQKQLDSTKDDNGMENQLFKHKSKTNTKIDYNSRESCHSNRSLAQKESQDALKRIQQNVIGMDEKADLIAIEMDRQIQKLDQIYDQLSDTETTLKRAQKHLKYFAKQVYTDRIMICLIILIGIAIIVIIGLAIAGKTPKQLNSITK